MDLEESEEIDEDYILWETSSALAMSGYKNSLSDAPWNLLKLSGNTNGEIIDEILTACSSDSFWDAYDVEQIFEKDGSWYAKIRYAYKALKTSQLFMREEAAAWQSGRNTRAAIIMPSMRKGSIKRTATASL